MLSESELRFEEVHPDSPEARWCLEQYYEELTERFEEGFDPGLSAVTDPADFGRPSGVLLVASLEGRLIGCGAVKLTTKDTGYIKRMWIDPDHRGRGLGRRMLGALEDAAADLGCTVVQLETHRSLTGAIELYRTAGYREVPPFNDEHYAHHWFEKVLPAKDRRRPRISVYVLIVSFAGVFVFGFLPGPRRLFLLPLFCLALAAGAVLSSAKTVRGGRTRRFLLLAGLGAATFVAGVLYGTFGMIGFYEINDLVYLTVVVGSGLGTVVGAAGSLATYSQAADDKGRNR